MAYDLFLDMSNPGHVIRRKRQPKYTYRWLYQWPGHSPETLEKTGKYWYYNTPGSGETGCDTLDGAKGDLLYAGAKVWREKILN